MDLSLMPILLKVDCLFLLYALFRLKGIRSYLYFLWCCWQVPLHGQPSARLIV